MTIEPGRNRHPWSRLLALLGRRAPARRRPFARL